MNCSDCRSAIGPKVRFSNSHQTPGSFYRVNRLILNIFQFLNSSQLAMPIQEARAPSLRWTAVRTVETSHSHSPIPLSEILFQSESVMFSEPCTQVSRQVSCSNSFDDDDDDDDDNYYSMSKSRLQYNHQYQDNTSHRIGKPGHETPQPVSSTVHHNQTTIYQNANVHRLHKPLLRSLLCGNCFVYQETPHWEGYFEK